MSGDVRLGSDEEWLLNAYDGLPWCSQYWVSREAMRRFVDVDAKPGSVPPRP